MNHNATDRPHPAALALQADATMGVLSQLSEVLMTVCQAAMTHDAQALTHAANDLAKYMTLMHKGAQYDLDLASARCWAFQIIGH